MPRPMLEVIAVRTLPVISVGTGFMHVTVRDESENSRPLV
jgi:hypothetical protein